MAPAKKSLSKDGPVVSRLARSGLFTKLLAICTLAAVVCASAATLTFYLYLDAIATNRVAAELNGQASALAPLAADVLAKIERGGALGLSYALGRLADLRATARRKALQRVILEGIQE